MIIDAAAAMPLRYALSLRAMSRRHFCFCRRCYYFSPDYAVFRLRLRFAATFSPLMLFIFAAYASLLDATAAAFATLTPPCYFHAAMRGYRKIRVVTMIGHTAPPPRDAAREAALMMIDADTLMPPTMRLFYAAFMISSDKPLTPLHDAAVDVYAYACLILLLLRRQFRAPVAFGEADEYER